MNPKHWLLGFVSSVWTLTAFALGSRRQFIYEYQTMATVTPPLEFFAARSETMLAILFVSAAILLVGHKQTKGKQLVQGLTLLGLACLPFGFNVARMVFEGWFAPSIWELIWFGGFTGFGLRYLAKSTDEPWTLSPILANVVIIGATILAACWWVGQCCHYYNGFQLGFNDVGHFAQRIANTANGNGFLLETPVLPPFWDHFNPGLILLVPLWKVMPRVELFFVVQAIALAIPAWQLYAIARGQKRTPAEACCWGLAWLFHPAISQMNLAYTYGWHPITLAVPFLFASIHQLLKGRLLVAIGLLLVAWSFEEGVIVIGGSFCAAMAIRLCLSSQSNDMLGRALPLWGWLVGFGCSLFSFLMVYVFSGLAEFQTARFSSLGNSALEVILSPLNRPYVFFGLLFRLRNFIFLGLLFVPLLVAFRRSAFWYWLALALPLGVLVMWEHRPAQCIAFQYTSCLLPVLYCGALLSQSVQSTSQCNRECDLTIEGRGFAPSLASFLAGWTLCLFVGQFPWTRATLDDVTGVGYGAGQEFGRRPSEADNLWIRQWIEDKRNGSASLRVLTTGRLATHFVGCQDIETVGQYIERFPKLELLTPNTPVIQRYNLIVLDTLERFQQIPDQITQIQKEAIANGFSMTEEKYGVQVFERSK